MGSPHVHAKKHNLLNILKKLYIYVCVVLAEIELHHFLPPFPPSNSFPFPPTLEMIAILGVIVIYIYMYVYVCKYTTHTHK